MAEANETPDLILRRIGEELGSVDGIDRELASILTETLLLADATDSSVDTAMSEIQDLAALRAGKSEEPG